MADIIHGNFDFVKNGELQVLVAQSCLHLFSFSSLSMWLLHTMYYQEVQKASVLLESNLMSHGMFIKALVGLTHKEGFFGMLGIIVVKSLAESLAGERRDNLQGEKVKVEGIGAGLQTLLPSKNRNSNREKGSNLGKVMFQHQHLLVSLGCRASRLVQCAGAVVSMATKQHYFHMSGFS